MALADDIRALRDRVLAELDAAHDYFADTHFAWRFLKERVAAGIAFTHRNPQTGTTTTETELVLKSQQYVRVQLIESTFQQFLAIFESFFFDFLRLWLTAYPRSLIGKQVDFKTVVEAADKDAIVLAVVNKELNDVLYERPANWFAYLNDKAKLGCPTDDEIARIAEAKATRDVLVHNRGVVGKTYVAKAGTLARYRAGEKIDLPDPYHRETWELLRKVVADLANAAVAKVP